MGGEARGGRGRREVRGERLDVHGEAADVLNEISPSRAAFTLTINRTDHKNNIKLTVEEARNPGKAPWLPPNSRPKLNSIPAPAPTNHDFHETSPGLPKSRLSLSLRQGCSLPATRTKIMLRGLSPGYDPPVGSTQIPAPNFRIQERDGRLGRAPTASVVSALLLSHSVAKNT